ncbi:hypothetical protein BSY16_4687 (plasmid) [Sinorhizobium sp. RAC02]|nr:hypothetical protein BSY16_4687 [Sinorhizobium sp. RAC02]
MQEIAIDILSDDAVEITLPRRCFGGSQPVVCACCGQAGQPMDDDGCGICDACLETPVQVLTHPDDLDLSDTFPDPSLTARHR